jgi:hypothetical protein|tara:strand:+ start:181 stop:486 length:306 start_codon:yes stop_codon:yes gene_type:complete
MDRSESVNSATYRMPSNETLTHAVQKAIVDDRPIVLDYWQGSLDRTVVVGVRDNDEKLLVKSAEEYTSPITKIFKVGSEYLVLTENSIYLVDAGIETRRIT